MTKHEDVGLHSVKMGTDETVEDSEFSPLRLLNHSGLETDSHFEKPDPGCSKRVKCSTKQEPHEEEHRDVSFEDRKRWENGLRSITTGERKSGLSCPRREPVGFRRVYYNEALEEALCFGWIDSRIKSLDEKRSMVRFTPRKSKNWSRYNSEKAMELKRKGKMAPAGLKVLPQEVVSQAEQS